MSLRKQQISKVALGVVLIVVSILIAIVILNAISAQYPENALPQLSVYYSGTENNLQLPLSHVQRDTYSWQFLFWNRQGGGQDLEIWREIIPAELQGNTQLALGFDISPQEVHVTLSSNEGPFEEMSGNLLVPNVVGTYVYCIDANFGEGKDVRYYVRIKVPW